LRLRSTLHENDAPITQLLRVIRARFAEKGHMLTEFQKRKIANLFAVHDLNHDGVLERSDYVEYVTRISAESGLGPGSAKYEELLSRFLGFWEMLRQMADRNQDNRVTKREWFALFDQLLASPEGVHKMGPIGEAVFAMLDRNGDGNITLDEYKWLYSSGALDARLAADSFKRLDTDRDGRITTSELSMRLFEFFMSDDPNAPGTWLFGPVAAERERQMA
jgi:juvenile hormone diol kinase